MNRPTTATSHKVERHPDELDAILEAFEDECALGGSVDLAEFLPDRSDPHFRAIAVELIRVDLEYSWRDGERKRLDAYRAIVPELFEDPSLLSGAAFEEYRLRRQVGEDVTSTEYVAKYGVSVDGWPSISPAVKAPLGLYDIRRRGAFPRVGDQLAEFTLVSELGRGAFATVFLAEQNDLARRPVALKVTTVRSFEPQHLARLQHTNIVPIYSVHEWNGLLAVCMPLLGSRTLADVLGAIAATDKLPQSGAALLSTVVGFRDETIVKNSEHSPKPASDSSAPLPKLPAAEQNGPARLGYVDFVLSLVADIGAGLDHAHQRGIVHRDVKPANILLTDDGRPMLLDFNLSDELVVNGTQSLAVGGTLPYMAVEHLRAVRHGGSIDARSDLYSLGVIMYQLLTGHQPYPLRDGKLDDTLDTMILDRTSQPPSVRIRNRLVSPAVAAIVHKCLEPSLERRYGSAGELVEDVRRQLEHLPLKHAPNPSAVERLSKWRRRHPRVTSLASLAAASLIMVIAFGGLWISRNHYVARLEAERQYEWFLAVVPEARMAISAPDSEGPLIATGIRAVTDTLELYGLPSGENWQGQSTYVNLPQEERQVLDERLVELGYLAARGESVLAKLEKQDSTSLKHWAEALEFNDVAWELCRNGSPQQAVLTQRKEILSKLGRPAETSRIASEDPPGALENMLRAQVLLQHRDFAGSLTLLEKIRSQQPTDPVNWLLAGNANAGLGRLHDAEGCFSTAIALQPDSYVAYYNRAMCRTQLGEYSLALPDFERVLALRPDLNCVLLNLALAYEAAGDLPLALADLDAAIAGGDVPPRTYLFRSRIRARLGDAEGARQDRLQGLAEEPTDEVGWVARGFAQMNEDPDGALRDYRRALALNPRSQLALKNIVHVTADRLALSNEALTALNTLIDLDESNAGALAGRAVLLARMNQRERALADLKRALKLSQDAVILFQGACCLSLTSNSENGDGARGLMMLSRSLELQPPLVTRATTDSDLKNLRSRPEFDTLLAKIQDLNQLKRELVSNAGKATN